MKTNLNLNQRGKSFFTSVCLFFLLLFATTLRSQNVSVSGAVTGNGTYADLSSAFAAINGGAQTSANISVSILASTSETAIAVLNAGAWTTMTISPSGGSYTISGSIADALVNLNGADNVRIDGLNTGGNALTLVNTNTATSGVSTIRFIGDASSNQVVNCTVLGAGTSASFGTITFSTGATGGNSNNTIQNCNIGSDGANYPAVAIYAAGTSTALNENNNIQSCNIYDFFNASVVSAGVLVGANNSGWTITGNRFYQTGARIFTTANTHRGIQVASGNNYLISNNTIGYSSSSGTGTLVMGGAVANRYNAIEVAAATATASSILNNTITAITLTTSSSAATANGVLCGVIVTSGNANIANNIIGGTSGTDLLFASPTTAQGMIVGINSSSTGTISIQNNYIGGCTSTGTAAALSGGINGINISGAAGLLSITNNTIGNQTVDNMRAGTNLFTTGNSLCVGINFASASTGVVQVSGNIIRNFASYGTGTGGTMRGIYTTGTSGSTTYSIVNNTISNLVSNNSNVAVGNGQLGTGGIIITYGSLNKILNNLISNIALTGTATTAVCMAGISTAVSTDPLISSNRIYDLSNAGTGTTTTGPPMVFGVFIRGSGGDCNVTNNMISLGNLQTTNTSFIGVGIFSGGGAPTLTRIYHNTISIMGVVTTGALPSFGIYRGNFSTSAVTFPVDIRNNLITNTRTGGTGAHCAIANNYGATTVSSSGWGASASNNNVLNGTASTIGWWTSAQTFAGWQTSSASDGASSSGITVTYINSANDLHLNMGLAPTAIESGGQAITTVTTDIDGQVRPGPAGSINGGALMPDIGADEIDGAPVTCTSAVGGTITPNSGSVCSGQTVSATSTSVSSGLGIAYQWQVAATAGGPYVNVTGGSGANTATYSSGPLSQGIFYVILKTTCNASITASSNEVTLTVSHTPTVSVSSGSSSICSGGSFSLSANSSTASSYMWTGPNSFTSTSQNPSVTNAPVAASGVYSAVATAGSCTSSVGQVTVLVNGTPGSLTVTPSSPGICAGGSQSLSVNGGNLNSVLAYTPQTNQNTTSSYPACYSAYYGGQKMQFLILASELAAAGISAGSFTSISFPVVSLGTNWGTSITECQNFQISMGQTGTPALTTGVFQTGLTTVLSSNNYTPVTGFNLHSFSTPFTWNGTSNIIVETIFSNNFAGTTADAVIQYHSPTTFQSTMLYRADNQNFTTIAAATNTNGAALGLARPDFILRGNSPVSFSWTPSAGLSGTTGTSVTASPALSSTYVVTAMNGACTSSTNVNVSVTSPPTLSIIASNSVVCAGDTTTLTASGASSYTWSGSNNTGTTEVVSPMTTSIYTLSNLTLPCGVVTETISIVANALPTVSATAVPTIVCAGQSTTLTATGASTYAWVGGPPTSTNVVSPTSNTSYTVTGTDANGCSDDEVVSVATNTVPVVSVSPQSPTVCASSAVTFTASGANTYSWSSGSPASTETVNPSSTTSYTVTGTNTLGCSSMVTVTVTTNPLPNLSISPAATATVCTSAEGSFTVSGASTYSWSTGSATDDLTIMVSTNTIITVEGTDANNCKSTATLTIVADPCTGIPEQIKLSGIRLFPNPSTGLVNIEFGFEGNKDIIITNSAGALIQKVSSPNTTEVINLSGYSKGIYFVKIQNEGRFADFKLIID